MLQEIERSDLCFRVYPRWWVLDMWVDFYLSMCGGTYFQREVVTGTRPRLLRKKDAWMTGDIFNSRLHLFDAYITLKHRKSLLVNDNCSSHGLNEAIPAKLLKLFSSTCNHLPIGTMRYWYHFHHDALQVVLNGACALFVGRGSGFRYKKGFVLTSMLALKHI